MRLLKRTTLMMLCAILVFSSCRKAEPLEPKEILKRSIVKNITAEASSFSASAFLQAKGYSALSGSAVAQGFIRGSGGWSADISFQGSDSRGVGVPESGKIRTVTLDGKKIFFTVESIQGPNVKKMTRSLTGSLNGWWSIGESPAGSSIRRTMSPKQLNEIVSLFTINSSSEPEIFLGDTRVYRLNISLLPNAVRNLFGNLAKENTRVEGTLWIHAKNFSLLRASWDMKDILTPLGPADLDIDITFSATRGTPNIVLPTGSSGILSL